MEIIDSKKLDHLGVVMGTIKVLDIIGIIDRLIPSDPQEIVTTGQCVAAMIINGLGFTDSPLSLTPHFFASKPVDLLFNEKIKADNFNRHRLGRALDEIHSYGIESLFSAISMECCNQQEVDKKFSSLDTTSFSVSGQYNSDTDENEINITHGYSKDHRADLKQAVLELIVSQDGGVPLLMKCFDGNSSDTTIFQERTAELVKQIKYSDGIKYFIADSKLYTKNTMNNLQYLKFITRVPRTYIEERNKIRESININQWRHIDYQNKYQTFRLTHCDVEQRWIVIHSDSAYNRSQKILKKLVQKEYDQLKKQLKKISSTAYKCADDATNLLCAVNKKLKFHVLENFNIDEKNKYSKKGRPTKQDHVQILFYISAEISNNYDNQQKYLDEKSCYVISTNIPESELSDIEVIKAYKNQYHVEQGFRFLKDPKFFASSFYLKKESRIMSLLMVMTLSLLVYSLAQRYLRNLLHKKEETIPNQINKPTSSPTLRWVFQLLDGISVVYMKLKDQIQHIITGITEIKEKILRFFRQEIQTIYKLNFNTS